VRLRASLEELRERDVLIEGDGLTLHVDALATALTEELLIALRENKLAPSLGTWTMRTISCGYS
jgi:hypothetical protein